MRRLVIASVASIVGAVSVACSTFGSGDSDPGAADAGDAGVEASATANATTEQPSPLPPGVVVTNEIGISSIAVDATDVYWTTGAQGGHVATCPKSGCAGPPRIIAAGQDSASHVALSGDRVVWIASDVVRSAPKSGGEVFDTTKGFTDAVPTGFLIVGNAAHVVDGRRIRVCNNPFTTLCDASLVSAISVSTSPLNGIVRSGAEDLFWSSVLLRRMALSSGSASATHTDPGGFVVAAAESEIVYATTDGALRAIPLTGVPDGGTVTELAVGLPSVTAIAVDVLDVIVLSEVAGKVLEVPRSGGVAPVELRAGLKAPRALAMYGNEVWVGEAGSGEILRLIR